MIQVLFSIKLPDTTHNKKKKEKKWQKDVKRTDAVTEIDYSSDGIASMRSSVVISIIF